MLRDTVAFAALTVAVTLAALAWHPDDWLISEDGLLEAFSALLYVGAALFGGATLLRLGRGAHPALWFIVPLGLVCALDEISYGARLFGFEAPALKGGGEFDGVHDLIILAKREFDALAVDDLLLAVAVGALAISASLLGRRPLIAAVRIALADPVLLRLGACVGLLAASQALDIDVVTITKQMYLEEWGEASGGFWLLAAALAARLPATAPQRLKRHRAESPVAEASEQS